MFTENHKKVVTHSGTGKKGKDKAKKQVPLRLSVPLWNEIAQWAEDDFRSMNGQIEYLLTECVKYRKKHRKKEE